jgi:Na+-driven multidrug efflux pump
VATILFDITLIPAFGIAGAALASLLSYTISAVTLLAAFRVVTGASLSALVPGRADLRVAVTYLMRYAARTAAGSRP